MLRSSNTVQLIGLVGKKPIISDAGNATSYGYFAIAEDLSSEKSAMRASVQIRWHDCLGTGVEMTDKIKTLSEGDRIIVQGSLTYDVKAVDGRQAKLAKILIHDFEILGRKPIDKKIEFRELDPTNSDIAPNRVN